MNQQIVYYVPDIAKILGKTESAVRNHIRRRDWSAIPSPVRIGGRLAWRQTDIDQWLEDKTPISSQNQQAQRGPGRPRKWQR